MRQAAQQGKLLEAGSRRGDFYLLSGVGQLRIEQEQQQRDEREAARDRQDGATPRDLGASRRSGADEIADEIASSLWMSEVPGAPLGLGLGLGSGLGLGLGIGLGLGSAVSRRYSAAAQRSHSLRCGVACASRSECTSCACLELGLG